MLFQKAVYELIPKVNAIQAIDTSDQLKEADCNTKIEDIEKKIPDHNKYITTLEYKKLITENFAERLKQAKLPRKDDIA